MLSFLGIPLPKLAGTVTILFLFPESVSVIYSGNAGFREQKIVIFPEIWEREFSGMTVLVLGL